MQTHFGCIPGHFGIMVLSRRSCGVILDELGNLRIPRRESHDHILITMITATVTAG